MCVTWNVVLVPLAFLVLLQNQGEKIIKRLFNDEMDDSVIGRDGPVEWL